MPRYDRQPARMKIGFFCPCAWRKLKLALCLSHGILSAIMHANVSLWWVPRGPEIVASSDKHVGHI